MVELYDILSKRDGGDNQVNAVLGPIHVDMAPAMTFNSSAFDTLPRWCRAWERDMARIS